MSQASDAVERAVGLVFGGGVGIGREAALRLAAAGVKVVVAGPDEAAIARVVGEITCGGGVARHIAGDIKSSRYLHAAVNKARETFGILTFTIAICADPADIAPVWSALYTDLAERLLVIARDDQAAARIGEFTGKLLDVALDLPEE
jgi:NAD(P)-dependent dehydrogenase (short-subunit alcohol dehydrogenase family)